MASQRFQLGARRSLAEQIADRIIEMILSGELQPNEKLPSERELAVRLNVSRPSLREALRVLAQLKIIHRQHGRGTYITSLDPALLLESLDYLVLLQAVSIDEVLETRRLLEAGIAGLASRRVTDDDLGQLEQQVGAMANTVDDPAAFAAADARFHDQLAAAAGNSLLVRLSASVRRLGQTAYIRLTQDQNLARQMQQEHAALVAALRSGDPATAASAMQRHVDSISAAIHASPRHEALEHGGE